MSLCSGEGFLHLRRVSVCCATIQDSAGEAVQQRYRQEQLSLRTLKQESDEGRDFKSVQIILLNVKDCIYLLLWHHSRSDLRVSSTVKE